MYKLDISCLVLRLACTCRRKVEDMKCEDCIGCGNVRQKWQISIKGVPLLPVDIPEMEFLHAVSIQNGNSTRLFV